MQILLCAFLAILKLNNIRDVKLNYYNEYNIN